MKIRKILPFLSLLLLFTLLFSFTVTANGATPPTINGAAFVLLEPSSGEILAEKNSSDKRFPASTTKIMTLVLALEEVAKGTISLEDKVSTSEYAAGMGGSQVYLFTGETRTLKEMLIGIAVGSGNDASVAVAEFIAGSLEGFVEMMNKKAQELGMANTHYANPHGLHDPNHYTTAADMGKLALHAISVPKLLEFTSIYEYDFRTEPKPLKLWNTNRLLKWYEGTDGIKTGFTSEAQRNLISTAKRGDLRLVSVVMGVEPANGHFTESMKLLNYGFNGFEYKPLYKAGEPICSVPVAKGQLPQIDAITSKAVGNLQEKGAKAEFTTQVKIDQPLTAPIEEHAKIGVLEIAKNNQVIGTIDLLAAIPVAKISLKTGWKNLAKELFLLTEF